MCRSPCRARNVRVHDTSPVVRPRPDNTHSARGPPKARSQPSRFDRNGRQRRTDPARRLMVGARGAVYARASGTKLGDQSRVASRRIAAVGSRARCKLNENWKQAITAGPAGGNYCVRCISMLVAAAALGVPTPVPAAGATTTYTVSPVADVSRGCAGQNAEVEQAADRSGRYVYELWMGCKGIAFARSADGGHHFSSPINPPGSVASSWDPALAVAPNGTVYASFMITRKGYTYPVVAASFDHGVTFSQVTSLVPPVRKNWGDRDFIAVAPDGAIYVTWDYGPSAAAVTYICNPAGSCAFATGDLNVVIQKSTDGGKTWGPIIPVSPGFPASGGDSAPLVIEPDGRIDLEYQGYHITNDVTYTMTPAHSYFTSSDDGGSTWSVPVQIGPDRLTMSKAEWWIDGAIGMDAGGKPLCDVGHPAQRARCRVAGVFHRPRRDVVPA